MCFEGLWYPEAPIGPCHVKGCAGVRSARRGEDIIVCVVPEVWDQVRSSVEPATRYGRDPCVARRCTAYAWEVIAWGAVIARDVCLDHRDDLDRGRDWRARTGGDWQELQAREGHAGHLVLDCNSGAITEQIEFPGDVDVPAFHVDSRIGP